MSEPLRAQLDRFLHWDEAHVDFDNAVNGIPTELRGAVAPGFEHSPWQLLEHIEDRSARPAGLHHQRQLLARALLARGLLAEGAGSSRRCRLGRIDRAVQAGSAGVPGAGFEAGVRPVRSRTDRPAAPDRAAIDSAGRRSQCVSRRTVGRREEGAGSLAITLETTAG